MYRSAAPSRAASDHSSYFLAYASAAAQVWCEPGGLATLQGIFPNRCRVLFLSDSAVQAGTAASTSRP